MHCPVDLLDGFDTMRWRDLAGRYPIDSVGGCCWAERITHRVQAEASAGIASIINERPLYQPVIETGLIIRFVANADQIASNRGAGAISTTRMHPEL